jgi:hypothetical protein
MKSKATPSKGPLKGKAALSKFLGFDPKDKGLSKDDRENYNGWIDWMKTQVRPERPPVSGMTPWLGATADLGQNLARAHCDDMRALTGRPRGADHQGL